MAGPLPHTAHVQQMMEKYLDDAIFIMHDAHKKLRTSKEFRLVYRCSLATHALLEKVLGTTTRPRPNAVESTVLRIPLIVATRQLSLARIELRRFVELVLWTIYFSEHPVEWQSFQASPDRGFAKSLDEPISYCAHREITFYLSYAKERIQQEPSGLAKEAIDSLRKLHGRLSAFVHPAHIAGASSRIPPFEDISPDALKTFVDIQRPVLAQACILLAACNRKRFDRLPPMHRAHFDWLIGTTLEKRLRSGHFGLPL
jgi:hypothetical protein